MVFPQGQFSGKDYRNFHRMKRVSILLLIGLNLLVTTAFAQYNLYQQAGNVHLLNYINNYRASVGLPAVVYDEGLAAAARLQAQDNYTRKKFRGRGDDVRKLHQNSRFPQVRDRVKAVGVATNGEFCAEICYAKAGMRNSTLAAAIRPYQSLEQLMFTKYKFSTSHRAIILTPEYTRAGIHTIYDGHYVYNAVVFMTGKPKKSFRRPG
jgi:uncharacterized protein YkwD